MAFSTFSGPIRVGTQKEGAARNTGLVKLVQVTTVANTAILTSPTAQNLFTLPAGSKILRFRLEVVTALSTATNCGVTLGLAGGTANRYMTSVNTGATVGAVAQATIDTATQVANTNNVGTTDVVVTGTFTAAGGNASAGAIVVTCEYVQRLDDGSSNPPSA